MSRDQLIGIGAIILASVPLFFVIKAAVGGS